MIISLFNSPKICFEPLDKDWRKVEAKYLLNFEHHLLKNVQRFHSFKVNEILNLKLYLRNDFLLWPLYQNITTSTTGETEQKIVSELKFQWDNYTW